MWENYKNSTTQRVKLLDAFMGFLVVVGGLQFAYCVVGGNYVSYFFLGGREMGGGGIFSPSTSLSYIYMCPIYPSLVLPNSLSFSFQFSLTLSLYEKGVFFGRGSIKGKRRMRKGKHRCDRGG